MPRYKHQCNSCDFLGYFGSYDLYYCKEEQNIIARTSLKTLVMHCQIDKEVVDESARFVCNPVLSAEEKRALYKGYKRFKMMQDFDNEFDDFQAKFRDKWLSQSETEDMRFLYMLKCKFPEMIMECLSSGEFCNSEVEREEILEFEKIAASNNLKYRHVLE